MRASSSPSRLWRQPNSPIQQRTQDRVAAWHGRQWPSWYTGHSQSISPLDSPERSKFQPVPCSSRLQATMMPDSPHLLQWFALISTAHSSEELLQEERRLKELYNSSLPFPFIFLVTD